MNKTALNVQLVTTRLKRGFYHLKSVDCVDQMCGKVLVLLPIKSMGSLILLLVGLVFSRYEILVVFWQVRVWDRKSAGGARVGVKTVARISQQGGQNHKVGHIFKYNIGCTQKLGAKHEIEDTYFKGWWGGGGAASPLETTLVCVRSLRGGSGQEFSNSCRSGQKM